MPAVSVQFALILEAYCRGSIPHIEVLKKQVGLTHTFLQLLLFPYYFITPLHIFRPLAFTQEPEQLSVCCQAWQD